MKRLIKPTFNLFPFDASHFDQKIYFMWRWTDINIEFGIFIPLMVFKIHSLWQFNGQTIIIFAIILVTNLVFWRITTSYFVQIFRNKIFRSKKKKKNEDFDIVQKAPPPKMIHWVSNLFSTPPMLYWMVAFSIESFNIGRVFGKWSLGGSIWAALMISCVEDGFEWLRGRILSVINSNSISDFIIDWSALQNINWW